MRTAEASGNDSPVLDPANAVLHPDSYCSQLAIELLLLIRQLSTLRLLEGGFDLQTGRLVLFPCLWIAHRDQGYLLVQALVAFVSIYFTSIRQVLQSISENVILW